MDLNQRSVRAQMKYADKLDARYNIVIGDNEVNEGTAKADFLGISTVSQAEQIYFFLDFPLVSSLVFFSWLQCRL